MESVPLEIWHDIFSSFSLKEKMECMRVCRSWWRYFDQHTLLSHVEIKDSQIQFTQFMDLIKQLPHRALQIKTIELNNCLPTKYNKRKLCNTFSTARVLKVLNERDADYKRNLQRRPLKTIPSSNRIEFLSDCFRCELASQMLVTNMCERLDTLQLDFLGVVGANGIFNQLKYAPVLQQLSLRSVVIRLEDLEIIHQNAPTLKALILEWISVDQGDDQLGNLTPATSLIVLHFTILDVVNLVTHIDLYQYINQKYPNVKDVKHRDAKIFGYNDNFLRALYFNGYLDFLKLIGRNKNRLCINDDAMDWDEDTPELFEFSGMRTAELYQDLFQSNEFHDIRELTLSNSEPNTAEVLRYMPVLTTLRLDFTGRKDPPLIDLTAYLNGCPDSVKEFDIDCFHVVIDQHAMRKYYIESLSINSNVIIPNYGDLIFLSLPALLRLKLTGFLVDSVSFVFHHDHPLEEATFILNSGLPVGINFKETGEGRKYLYNDREGTRMATLDDIQHLKTLSILSNKDRRLIFDDHNIIRMVLDESPKEELE